MLNSEEMQQFEAICRKYGVDPEFILMHFRPQQDVIALNRELAQVLDYTKQHLEAQQYYIKRWRYKA